MHLIQQERIVELTSKGCLRASTGWLHFAVCLFGSPPIVRYWDNEVAHGWNSIVILLSLLFGLAQKQGAYIPPISNNQNHLGRWRRSKCRKGENLGESVAFMDIMYYVSPRWEPLRSGKGLADARAKGPSGSIGEMGDETKESQSTTDSFEPKNRMNEKRLYYLFLE